MARTLLLALDAGGGGGHAIVIDAASGALTRAHRPWQYATAPDTDGLGIDADLPAMWSALASAAREALERAGATPGEVAGIAATGMRHGMAVLDRRGEALLAVPTRDGRAIMETLACMSEPPAALYDATGHWPNPVAAAMRWQWLASHRPEAAAGAAVMLSLTDWIAYRLCGEQATDPTQASETLLLDLPSRAWSAQACERLGVPRRVLPAVVEPGTRLGALAPEAADALGLRPGIAVAVAGGDTQCGVLGAGMVAAGTVAAIGGTTMPLQMITDRVHLDPERRIWTACFLARDRWVLESNGGSAGDVLDWLARLLAPDAAHPVARLLAEADRSRPGAAGTLSTFGGGIMDARALELPMGSLTLSHLATAADPGRRDHVARALIEGMAYGARGNLEQLARVAGATASEIAFAGGLARSDTFARILAEALGRPLRLGRRGDATAVGAAICAGVAAGVFADLEDGARRLAAPAETITPVAERAAASAATYATWRRVKEAQRTADGLARDAVLPAMLAGFGRAAAAAAAPLYRPRILVTADMDEAALGELRALGEVEYASFRDTMRLLGGDTLVAALDGVQVLVTEVDLVDAAVLVRARDLRVVAACRSDAVNVDVEACTLFGVPVLHAPGRNAGAVADLTLAFLLALARKLPEATAFLRQPGMTAGDMGRMGQAFTTLRGRELWGKTVGLVGLGAVGREVARRLAAFGGRVLVSDPFVSAEAAALVDAEPVALEELLARSDFVSLHAPVTERTRGLVDAAALARMKPGACLVNTARAALVDEAALAEALRTGHLGGAALDVFSVEPPGADHPLLAAANVIATPHVGGNTVEVGAHQGRIVAAELRRMVAGERPLHALNAPVLDAFGWERARPEPDAAAIARLAAKPGPAVSDLQRDRRAPAPAASAGAVTADPALVARMRRLLEDFLARASADAALAACAAGEDVTLHFTLPEVGLEFFLRLRDGRLVGAIGRPEGDADVELRMRAEVLDGMFTGTLNPMQAATSGRISFAGDTMKAMTLQQIQDDLSRCYRAARAAVGDPGDLAGVPEPGGAPAAAPRPLGEGDVRSEILVVVRELYASGLITATGGNVSARIPGADELWITPSQSFKGELVPEMLVRIDLDGRPLDAGALAPSSERLMHCAVYRARADAQAVIHAHAPHATILADVGLPFLPVSTEAAFFGDIPRIPFIMPGTQELASAIGEAMRGSWAVLMQNHGLLVAGRSLRRAADMVEVIDRSCEVILGCHQVGKPPSVLPPAVIAMLQKMGDMMA